MAVVKQSFGTVNVVVVAQSLVVDVAGTIVEVIQMAVGNTSYLVVAVRRLAHAVVVKQSFVVVVVEAMVQSLN